jgi:hypothetical protein
MSKFSFTESSTEINYHVSCDCKNCVSCHPVRNFASVGVLREIVLDKVNSILRISMENEFELPNADGHYKRLYDMMGKRILVEFVDGEFYFKEV